MPESEQGKWLRQLTGRDATNVARWLSGKTVPDAVPLLRIMGALEIAPDALLEETIAPLPRAGWEVVSAELARQSEQLARQHDELMEAIRSLAGNAPRASGDR